MIDLLPPNATAPERALADTTARVGAVPVPIRGLWDPQTCPVAVLPWLAWAMSVDDWDSTWTEQQKRDVIAASVDVHRHKGTVAAMKAALRPLNYEVGVEEPPSLPYRFRIRLNPGDDVAFDMNTMSFDRAQQIALRVKNVRSWLIGVQAMRKSTSGIFFGCCGLLGDLASVYPYIVGALDSVSGVWIAMTLFSYETASVFPAGPPKRLIEGGGYRLLEGGGKRLLES